MALSLPARNSLLRLGLGLGWMVLLVGLDLAQRPPLPAPARAVWAQPGAMVAAPGWEAEAGGLIPMPAQTPSAHASHLLALPADSPGVVQAYWFAGSRESGPDVRIATSVFERATQRWSEARYVVDREQAAAQLGFGLRRLGNPVAWRDARGRTHLFVVATGLGGWAAARILHLRQDTAQADFRPLRVLPLSWLWNISHLVRTMPLPLADGGMVLPAYFELGAKYPVALRFDAQGEFRGLVRISARRHLLQPTLLAASDTQWMALMRDGSNARQLRAARSDDAGLHWRDLPDPGLANPDAAVAALALRPDAMVLAHNPQASGRARLDLSASVDGLHWASQLTLAVGPPGSEYSYPSMTWDGDRLWVSYTDQRRAIAWQRLAPRGSRQ